MSLLPPEEEAHPRKTEAETFQPKAIVVFYIIESSWKTFFLLSMQLHIQSAEALVDIAYQIRPTVGKD